MVFAPAKMGEVGIAPRHAPLLTALSPGEVRIQDEDGKEESFYITGGLLEVQPHIVTVLADTALREWFGVEKPRIAVAGLNPHAGEDGRFGDEESRIISPAILLASEAGINVSGPSPGVTDFNKALDGKFDCVVAMYHDQGLIPIKLLAWEDAVNVTLGLPIVRTSPDHGTAFDIAGKNKASASSMIAAISLAIDLATGKAAHHVVEGGKAQ